MSWSISKYGFAGVVAAKVSEDIQRIKCAEPEETIKNMVGAAIIHSLESFPADFPVKVEASGSQSTIDGKLVNTLNTRIEPQYGFVK